MADKEKEPEGKDKSASSDKDLTDLTSSLRSENPAGRYASAAQKAMDAEENSWKGAGGYRYILEQDGARIRILDQNGQTTYARRGTGAYDAIMAERRGGEAEAPSPAPNLAEAAGESPPSGAPALTDTAKASGVDLGEAVPAPVTKPSMRTVMAPMASIGDSSPVEAAPKDLRPARGDERSVLTEVVKKLIAKIEADEAEQEAARAGGPSPNDAAFTSPASNMGPTV